MNILDKSGTRLNRLHSLLRYAFLATTMDI